MTSSVSDVSTKVVARGVAATSDASSPGHATVRFAPEWPAETAIELEVGVGVEEMAVSTGERVFSDRCAGPCFLRERTRLCRLSPPIGDCVSDVMSFVSDVVLSLLAVVICRPFLGPSDATAELEIVEVDAVLERRPIDIRSSGDVDI